jgi:hypothetical protein
VYTVPVDLKQQTKNCGKASPKQLGFNFRDFDISVFRVFEKDFFFAATTKDKTISRFAFFSREIVY